MVIPYNPKSTAQTEVRTVFAALVRFGRRIVTTTLNPYTKPKPKKMSPFNKFISNNQPMIDSGSFNLDDLVVSKGSLFPPASITLTAGAPADPRSIVWTTGKIGEAKDDDKIIIVFYNEDQDLFAFSDDKERSDGSTSEALDGATGETIHAYLFAVQGETLNSDTKHDSDDVTA